MSKLLIAVIILTGALAIGCRTGTVEPTASCGKITGLVGLFSPDRYLRYVPEGIKVEILETAQSTFSDSLGHFDFSCVPPGYYHYRYSKAGFPAVINPDTGSNGEPFLGTGKLNRGIVYLERPMRAHVEIGASTFIPRHVTGQGGADSIASIEIRVPVIANVLDTFSWAYLTPCLLHASLDDRSDVFILIQNQTYKDGILSALLTLGAEELVAMPQFRSGQKIRWSAWVTSSDNPHGYRPQVYDPAVATPEHPEDCIITHEAVIP